MGIMFLIGLNKELALRSVKSNNVDFLNKIHYFSIK